MMIDKTPPPPSARVTWRGSFASAALLADYVNLIDSVDYRDGQRVATADADITTTTYGSAADPIRRTTAVCTVDAYDGRHTLYDGDTLVQAEGGWIVEKRA
ncbi:hypothetical protein [Curtobacterium sp. UCD-KPL2560]|uniref:hypothetical protein n=1 Tax=Curtobacterium sp. UCD-KPL2560 TaxID=1885315 RepID=UPI000826CF9B|nr:hypothetical protein [Curtobacterium sp. UCD-KPL2560]